MATSELFIGSAVSRRGLLRGAALAVGGGAILSLAAASSPAYAQTKISQKLAQYQTTPKGNSRCNVCTQWQSPSACKVVAGEIEPTGWCNLFAAKY